MSSERLNLRALWGEVQRAVSERRTVAETWQIANDAAQARGFAGVSGGIQAMNAMRGTAAQIRDAAERFGRLDASGLIGPEHYAPDINAQSVQGRSITPVYRVRFTQTVNTLTGQLATTQRTISFPFQLPSTKADLLAELEINAASMAETYGEQHLGISDIEITVV